MPMQITLKVPVWRAQPSDATTRRGLQSRESSTSGPAHTRESDSVEVRARSRTQVRVVSAVVASKRVDVGGLRGCRAHSRDQSAAFEICWHGSFAACVFSSLVVPSDAQQAGPRKEGTSAGRREGSRTAVWEEKRCGLEMGTSRGREQRGAWREASCASDGTKRGHGRWSMEQGGVRRGKEWEGVER